MLANMPSPPAEAPPNKTCREKMGEGVGGGGRLGTRHEMHAEKIADKMADTKTQRCHESRLRFMSGLFLCFGVVMLSFSYELYGFSFRRTIPWVGKLAFIVCEAIPSVWSVFASVWSEDTHTPK